MDSWFAAQRMPRLCPAERCPMRARERVVHVTVGAPKFEHEVTGETRCARRIHETKPRSGGRCASAPAGGCPDLVDRIYVKN